MARPFSTLARARRPDAATPGQLVTADPNAQRTVLPATGVSPDLVDQLDAAAEAEHTTRKVMTTRALVVAGYHVRPADLEDRTPKTRHSRRAMA